MHMLNADYFFFILRSIYACLHIWGFITVNIIISGVFEVGNYTENVIHNTNKVSLHKIVF